MSQIQTLDDVPALRREQEVVASSLDDKAPHSPSIPAVDKESEPIVTRRELWSYYCTCLRDLPRSCKWRKRLSSVL